MKNLLLLFVLTAFCSIFISTLEAQTNPKISVQGTLKDANSITVADGTYPITFKLYHELTGGTAVWEETADVAVSGGIYSYNIGTTEVLNPAVFEQPVFLGINVNGIELSPRGEMTFAPYALAVEYAATAGTIVGGIDMTNLTQDISTTQNIHADGNITVGMNNLNATAGEESLRIVRGAIEHNYSDPTNPTIIAGAGFTVSYCSTGCPNANPGNWTRTYLITFDTPFSAPPIVTANITRNNGLYPVIVHTSVNSVDITLLHTNDAVTNGDGNFQFIVVGPR